MFTTNWRLDSPLSTVLARLADPRLLNWQFLLTTAFVYGLILRTNRLAEVDAPVLPVLLTWFAGQTFLLGAGLSLRRAMRRVSKLTSSSLPLLSAVFVIAVVHSELTEELLERQSLRVVPTPEAFHVVAGLFGILVYYLFAETWGAHNEWRQTTQRLNAVAAANALSTEEAKQRFADEAEALSRRIRESVLPVIAQIQGSLRGRGLELRSDLLQELETAVAEEVRPLGRTLRDEDVSGRFLEQFSGPVPLFRIPDRLVVRDLVQPELMVLFPGILTVFEAVADPRTATPAIATASVLCTYLAMHLLRRSLPADSSPRALGLLLFVAIAIGSNLPDFALMRFTAQSPDASLAFLLSHDLIAPLYDAAVAYLLLLERNVAATRQQLSATQRRFEETRQRYIQRNWILRRDWSYLLHGRVQSALAASLVRLELPNLSDETLVDAIATDLVRARDAIAAGPTDEVDLFARLDELDALWQGICDISVEVDPEVRGVVTTQPTLQFALNEILTEAVSNAVRHGDASSLRIHLTQAQGNAINLQVMNDGFAPTVADEASLGSTMMDELTLTWSLAHDVERAETMLTAVVPY